MGSWEPGIEDFEHKYNALLMAKIAPCVKAKIRGRVYILDVFVSTSFTLVFIPIVIVLSSAFLMILPKATAIFSGAI